jgi:hypothetical protein
VDCGEELASVATRTVDTLDNQITDDEPDMGDPVLYECPHCGGVLGISQ